MKRKFAVRNSRINGQGVFATAPISARSVICRMAGEEIGIGELQHRFATDEERGTDPLQVSATTYLDLHEPFVLFNHSCTPNAAIVGWNELVAIQDIRAGEEIAYDYSLTAWEDSRNWPGYDEWVMPCHCGTKNCRKKVVEFRFLLKKLQRSAVMEHRVQEYILKKYQKRI